MDVTISNVITVHEPVPELVAWANKNLELTNPDYEKKVRMGYWVGQTPKTIRLYETRGTDLILPYGLLRNIWPIIRDTKPIMAFPEPYNVNYGDTNIPLYDYQEEAVEAMLKAKFGILQSPAGSGKTQMGVALIKKFERRALWLTHTVDLLNQSKERAAQYIDKKLLGTITAGKVEIGEGITFATVQTMSTLDLSQYEDLWDVVVVDEVHRVAGSPTKVTMFYKVLNHLKARHKYGLSATVHRADGLIKCAYALIGNVVHEVSQDTVASKIMHVGIAPRYTGVPVSDECLNPDGTLNYVQMINYLASVSTRNKQIVADLVEQRGHSCLILSDRLEHLATLMDMLPPDMRENAAMMSGKMVSKREKELRSAILDEMRDGTLKYLFATYSLAKEGLDVPRLDRLFMATPVKDETVVIQSIGRIARTYPGKDNPICFDYVDYIPFCRSAYKQRTRHYNKNGAYYVP